ncbi:MAG: helix-turn-helix transcriptional regulator [Aureispira sp.]
MNKFDRVVTTLVLLQGKKIVTAATLAERFGVSLRTIYRDVQTLKTAGVPIIGDPGFGYSIMEGYRLPPIAFTETEALALLTAEKMIGSLAGADAQAQYSAAMHKIRAVLRGADKQAVEALDSGLNIKLSRFHYELPQLPLQELFSSIAKKQVIHLQYCSASEQVSERDVEPVGCYHQNGRWYLMGFCRTKQAYRNFLVNRMQRVRVLQERYEQEHIDLQTFLKEQEDRLRSSRPQKQEIELVFDPSIQNFAKRQKYAFGFVKEFVKEGNLHFVFENNSIEMVARWLISYGNGVTVIRPFALQQRLSELAQELFAHYQPIPVASVER